MTDPESSDPQQILRRAGRREGAWDFHCVKLNRYLDQKVAASHTLLRRGNKSGFQRAHSMPSQRRTNVHVYGIDAPSQEVSSL